MTQALPGAAFRQAHITILPPRPLHIPVDEASRYTRAILDRFGAFEVELSTVRRFPTTNVLYLDLTEGYEEVHRVHDALNSGDLAFEEQFEFHPHLTLADPAPGEDIEELQAHAEDLWSGMPEKERFVVREIVALWAEPGHKALSWKRLWVHLLRSDQTKTAYVGTSGQTS